MLQISLEISGELGYLQVLQDRIGFLVTARVTMQVGVTYEQ